MSTQAHLRTTATTRRTCVKHVLKHYRVNSSVLRQSNYDIGFSERRSNLPFKVVQGDVKQGVLRREDTGETVARNAIMKQSLNVAKEIHTKCVKLPVCVFIASHPPRIKARTRLWGIPYLEEQRR